MIENSILDDKYFDISMDITWINIMMIDFIR